MAADIINKDFNCVKQCWLCTRYRYLVTYTPWVTRRGSKTSVRMVSASENVPSAARSARHPPSQAKHTNWPEIIATFLTAFLLFRAPTFLSWRGTLVRISFHLTSTTLALLMWVHGRMKRRPNIGRANTVPDYYGDKHKYWIDLSTCSPQYVA